MLQSSSILKRNDQFPPKEVMSSKTKAVQPAYEEGNRYLHCEGTLRTILALVVKGKEIGSPQE